MNLNTPSVSVQVCCYYNKVDPSSEFKYTKCVGSRYLVEIDFIELSIFKYTKCVGSSLPQKMSLMIVIDLNTPSVSVQAAISKNTCFLSYLNTPSVSVQDLVGGTTGDVYTVFKYTKCVGSSIFYPLSLFLIF